MFSVLLRGKQSERIGYVTEWQTTLFFSSQSHPLFCCICSCPMQTFLNFIVRISIVLMKITKMRVWSSDILQIVSSKGRGSVRFRTILYQCVCLLKTEINDIRSMLNLPQEISLTSSLISLQPRWGEQMCHILTTVMPDVMVYNKQVPKKIYF